MKRNSFFTYFVSVLAILLGIYLSIITHITPLLVIAIRMGHVLLITGILIIIMIILGFYRKRRTSSSVELLFSQYFGKFYLAPWIIKKKENRVYVSTDTKYAISVIYLAIIGCALISYLLIHSFEEIFNGIIEISLSTVVMILISIYAIGAIFIYLNLFSLLGRIIRIIDKDSEIIKVSKSINLDDKNLELRKNELQIPIVNLKNSKIEERGYFQYLVPLDCVIGDSTFLKSWIYEEKCIIIKSRDENFIKSLNSGLLNLIDFK